MFSLITLFRSFTEYDSLPVRFHQNCQAAFGGRFKHMMIKTLVRPRDM